jgi:sigma-E factor negative regulatory protein RseA
VRLQTDRTPSILRKLRMSSQLKETLSAVVDGEATYFETRRLIEETGRDSNLRSLWARYHLIGASMRREGEVIESKEALDRFWNAIDSTSDSAVDGASVPAATRRLRFGRVTGAAVAAAVALGVVIAFGPGTPEPVELGNGVAGIDSSALSLAPVLGTPAQVVSSRPEPRLTVRLLPSDTDVHRAQAYMLHHAHQTALNQRSTAGVPFVKVAAFESR